MSQHQHKDEPPVVKAFFGFSSILGFTADIIAITIFVSEIIGGRLTEPSTVFSRSLVIITIFALAMFSFLYSRKTVKFIDNVVWIFSYLYVFYSAVIFGYVSWIFLNNQKYEYNYSDLQYGFFDYFVYILLIGAMASLGAILSNSLGRSTKGFAIPFMIVALEQVFIWVYLILNGAIGFNRQFMYNFVLFLYAGLIVVLFVGQQHLEPQENNQSRTRH